MSRSLGQTADAARVIPRLHVENAEEYVAGIARTFGVLSYEYSQAVRVLQAEHAALLATYHDEGLAEASGLDGVPMERTS